MKNAEFQLAKKFAAEIAKLKHKKQLVDVKVAIFQCP